MTLYTDTHVILDLTAIEAGYLVRLLKMAIDTSPIITSWELFRLDLLNLLPDDTPR